MSRQIRWLVCVIAGSSLLVEGKVSAEATSTSLPWGARADDYAVRGRSAIFYGGTKSDSPARSHLYRFDFATSAATRLLGDEAEQRWLRQGAQHLDVSPDGRLAVLTAGTADVERGTNTILMIDTITGHVRTLVSNGRNNIFPRFSPDGREVAFYNSRADMEMRQSDPGTKGFALSVVDIATSEIRRLAPEDWRLMRDGPPSWSPDGMYLAYSGMYEKEGSGAIYIVSREGGESLRVTPSSAHACCRPVWLGNKTILYKASLGLFIANTDGTGNHPIFRGALLTTPEVSPDGRRICFMGVPFPSADRKARLIVLDTTGRVLPGPYPDIIHDKWRR